MTSTTTTTKNFKQGDKVRVLADTNYNGLGVGSVVTLVGAEGEDTFDGGLCWLATKDAEVAEWTNGVCAFVRDDEMELVAESFRPGDRVRRNAKDHIYGSTNYHHNEAVEGTLGTVSDWSVEPYIHVEWDRGRGSVILPEALDAIPAKPTAEDVLELAEAIKSAQGAVDGAEMVLESAQAELDAAIAKRDEARAALTAILA